MTDGRLINDAGTLRGTLALQGQAPLGQGLDLAGIVASGEAVITAESFAMPQVAEGIDGESEATFELAAGRLEAGIGPARIDIESLAPRLAALAEPLPPPWRIALGDGVAPLRVTGTLAGETGALRIDGALNLAAGQARLGAELATSLGIEDDGRLDRDRGPGERHRRAAPLARGPAGPRPARAAGRGRARRLAGDARSRARG